MNVIIIIIFQFYLIIFSFKVRCNFAKNLIYKFNEHTLLVLIIFNTTNING